MTNSFDLALPINDGSLGNNGSEYMMVKQQQQQQQSRIISAASSVVSANSLSSSSTKASSMGAAGGGANIATQANVNWLKKSLEEKKESDLSDDSDNSNGLARTISPRSNSTASSSRSSPVTTATGNKSTAAATNPMVMHMGAPPHPVAEFLFQLTKMLTDNNSEYIEWRNASIFVHNPPVSKGALPFVVSYLLFEHMMCPYFSLGLYHIVHYSSHCRVLKKISCPSTSATPTIPASNVK